MKTQIKKELSKQEQKVASELEKASKNRKKRGREKALSDKEDSASDQGSDPEDLSYKRFLKKNNLEEPTPGLIKTQEELEADLDKLVSKTVDQLDK